jgi:hypothetical protein
MKTTYEVRDGHLIVDGALLPLNKGLILLALSKAGWKGAEGVLSPELASRTLQADPRIGALLRRAS